MLRPPFSTYAPSSDLLADRVILITGANGGIGRAVALAAADAGATVVLLGRTVKKLEAVYDEIETRNGPEPAIYPMDLAGATTAHYEELAERLEDQLGGLHGIVHTAALLSDLCPFEQINPAHWTLSMQVNVNAPFELVRACLPALKRATSASVVFSSSATGRRGRAYWGAYNVAKFAIEGMTQVLAEELEGNTHVRVNALNPVAAQTPMRASAFPGESPATVPSPATIAPAYLYLLGRDSVGITGQSFDVLETDLPST